MWHASGRGQSIVESRRLALNALRGVGDARLGEWHERGGNGVWHVRRRVTAEEQHIVGELRDVRGTPEEQERFAALLGDCPPALRERLEAMWLSH